MSGSFKIKLDEKGRLMGTVLAQYPSGSNPAKQYNIIEGRDGVVYCDCMGWKMNKHCKHLKDFDNGAQKANQVFANDGQMTKISPKRAKKDPEPSLDRTIENIVNEIKYGG